MPHGGTSHNFGKKLLIAVNGDRPEAKLIRRALALASVMRGHGDDVLGDNVALATFRRSFFTSGRRGGSFRDYHRISLDELQISVRDAMFRGPPDQMREEHSAFCTMMYQGMQARFLDRHPGETPEAFLDRPRKTTLNLTRIAIDILSSLYRKPPVRKFTKEPTENVKTALEEIWSDAYNLQLLETDRFTRLVGTCAVRPFYDPDVKGKIRLELYLSHQLRVMIDPRAPWQPLAAIERPDPFAQKAGVNLWTAKTFVQVKPNGSITIEPHTLGRIPLTFFRDRLPVATGSFFVEGKGRGLCDQNATINSKLTDLNEVYQYQGFSVPVVINPDQDEIDVGPRQPVVFRPQPGEQAGLTFANPSAPLATLRGEVEADIGNLFKSQRIPVAALGVALGSTPPSGVSIRMAMAPLTNDFEERARLFQTPEQDLADNCLRVRAEHDENFEYAPAVEKPEFLVKYQKPEFPLELGDRLKKDEFDIAHGVSTPWHVLFRENPDEFDSLEKAFEAWAKNIRDLQANPLPDDMAEEPGLDAKLGGDDPAAAAPVVEEKKPILVGHISSGTVTINEVRRSLGLPPIAGGDRTSPELLAAIGAAGGGGPSGFVAGVTEAKAKPKPKGDLLGALGWEPTPSSAAK